MLIRACAAQHCSSIKTKHLEQWQCKHTGGKRSDVNSLFLPCSPVFAFSRSLSLGFVSTAALFSRLHALRLKEIVLILSPQRTVAAVSLSLWSVSACIITEQWTMYPEVKTLLRIWHNNYIVICLKNQCMCSAEQFSGQRFTFSTSSNATDSIQEHLCSASCVCVIVTH